MGNRLEKLSGGTTSRKQMTHFAGLLTRRKVGVLELEEVEFSSVYWSLVSSSLIPVSGKIL